MKKIYYYFLSLFTAASLFVFATPAYAQLCPPGDFAKLCDLDPSKNPKALGNAIARVINVLIIIAVILCLIYLVYGGIKWITSGGEKAKIDAARSHLTAAIIGLIIALLAFAIVNTVSYFFLGQSLGSGLKIPTLLD